MKIVLRNPNLFFILNHCWHFREIAPHLSDVCLSNCMACMQRVTYNRTRWYGKSYLW